MHEMFESEANSVLFELNFAAGAGFPAKQHKQQVSMIGKAMAHHAYTCTHRTKWFEPTWGLSRATIDHLGLDEQKD